MKLCRKAKVKAYLLTLNVVPQNLHRYFKELLKNEIARQIIISGGTDPAPRPIATGYKAKMLALSVDRHADTARFY